MRNQLIEEKLLSSLKDKNKRIQFPLIQNIEGNNSEVLITFVYIGDENTKNVVVISPLGSETLKENLMINIENTNIWYITYVARNDIKFKYYFSINDSLTDKCNNRLKNGLYDKLNKHKLTFDNGQVISYVVMPNCKNRLLEEMTDVPRGKLLSYELYSKFLKEYRKILIYIPYDFRNKINNCGFAVFIDGKEHIDILSSHKILDNLIFKKQINPLVGVFIESNSNRAIDLRCSKDFEKFIIYELIPFIQEKYNISKNPSKNIITGFSLGGLMATYIALKHPKIFKNLLSQSSSYYFKFKELKKEIKRNNGKLNVYMDVGILENEKIIIEPNNKIYALLRKRNIK